MKKQFLISLMVITVMLMPFISQSQTSGKSKQTQTTTKATDKPVEKQKAIINTTLDLKQAYDVIQVITGYSEITTTPTKDSFLKSYMAAWTNLGTEAYNQKADAVIGIHVDFITTPDSYIRIIIYGTAVKFK